MSGYYLPLNVLYNKKTRTGVVRLDQLELRESHVVRSPLKLGGFRWKEVLLGVGPHRYCFVRALVNCVQVFVELRDASGVLPAGVAGVL